MKQIKTIVASMDNGERFDSEVNLALHEGWELVERRLVQPPAQLDDDKLYWGATLYAELEKEEPREQLHTLPAPSGGH